MTPKEYQAMVMRIATEIGPMLQKDIVKAGEMTERLAKEMVGEEIPGWPPLEATTVERKEREGYTGNVSATDPLLRTGTLRDSIGMEVFPSMVVVGSNDPVLTYQEFGTSRIPPRPLLRMAAEATLPFLGEEIQRDFVLLFNLRK